MKNPKTQTLKKSNFETVNLGNTSYKLRTTPSVVLTEYPDNRKRVTIRTSNRYNEDKSLISDARYYVHIIPGTGPGVNLFSSDITGVLDNDTFISLGETTDHFHIKMVKDISDTTFQETMAKNIDYSHNEMTKDIVAIDSQKTRDISEYKAVLLGNPSKTAQDGYDPLKTDVKIDIKFQGRVLFSIEVDEAHRYLCAEKDGDNTLENTAVDEYTKLSIAESLTIHLLEEIAEKLEFKSEAILKKPKEVVERFKNAIKDAILNEGIDAVLKAYDEKRAELKKMADEYKKKRDDGLQEQKVAIEEDNLHSPIMSTPSLSSEVMLAITNEESENREEIIPEPEVVVPSAQTQVNLPNKTDTNVDIQANNSKHMHELRRANTVVVQNKQRLRTNLRKKTNSLNSISKQSTRQLAEHQRSWRDRITPPPVYSLNPDLSKDIADRLNSCLSVTPLRLRASERVQNSSVANNRRIQLLNPTKTPWKERNYKVNKTRIK